MDHPFIDASTLNDEELLQKIQKCQSYLYGEIQGGHAGMVDSIRMQLQTYEFEFQERMEVNRMKAIEKKYPDETIEIGTISSVETPDPNADLDLQVKRQKDL